MGWFSKLLLPGRLRTGPTVLLPARPDAKTLLAIAQLADPDARLDGEDILVGGSRILPPVELTGEVLAKLGVEGEECLWACRVAADGPLPVDFFDKTLAEGIAHRLGGWSLCQGEPTDPAEDRHRNPVVYLPAAPTPEEALPILADVLRHAEEVDVERWPDGELVGGVVHVPVRQGRVLDVYAGADLVVTIEEGHRIPPAARVRWPYLTEIAVVTVSDVTVSDVAAAPAAGEGAPEEDAAEDTSERVAEGDAQEDAEQAADAAAETAAPALDEPLPPDTPGEVVEAVTDDSAEDSVDDSIKDSADDSADDSPDGEKPMLARATVALVLADRLQGIAADPGAFQLAEPADILPGRYV
ncbi:hypothetical protein JOL79_13870 [Microbispora sp. RL4-1S]|uniref:Uncharacterized protein n=1 Tax=Microbispora oryzae TaxID=2806554 RepID=A0A940WHG5_9ACTN|nr:hypothetical protein [Microbispora oryzae]MBP2704903.1 hypothetical protein [Microbispora oryzae]